MTNDMFVELLKKAKLNKKEFSEKTKLAYSTVANWTTTNSVPDWVESWIENYLKSKSYLDIKNKVFEIENIQVQEIVPGE